MEFVNRFLGHRPYVVIAAIVLAMGWAFWKTHDYIQNTVRPAEQAARMARLESRIAEADADFKRKKFAAALIGYRVLLTARAEELSPAQKGSLQYRAGLSHLGLADQESEKDHLAKALEAFQTALEFQQAAGDGAGQADSHMRIGRVHARLGEAARDPARMDLALAAFRKGLQSLGAESDPARYGTLHVLIGNVLRDRFASGAGQKDELMNPALAAYGEAERATTLGNEPLVLAFARKERAAAYLRLAEGVFVRTHTRNALADVTRVFEAVTETAHPRDFGNAQRLMGDIYRKMSLDVRVDTGQAWRDRQVRTDWEQSAERAYALASRFGAGPPASQSNGAAK